MQIKRKVGIFFLILLSSVLYWFYTGQFVEGTGFEEVNIGRIIDGDTLVLNNSEKVRLVGINSPEKKMLYFEESFEFVESLVLGENVLLDRLDNDRYGRVLGYIFVDDENLNELILRQGFGNLYYYGKDEYYDSMKAAEMSARNDEKGIWKRSENYDCLEIEEFIWLDEGEEDSETLVLKNNCNKMEITIKDDATHIYEREIDEKLVLETKDIWNDNGDSLYIWDKEGLVLFFRY